MKVKKSTLWVMVLKSFQVSKWRASLQTVSEESKYKRFSHTSDLGKAQLKEVRSAIIF